MKRTVSYFRKGLNLVKESPQLIYTLFTALVIFLSFLFISNNFLSIAKTAQDRLVNVKIGSMHDVMTEFVLDYLETPEVISNKMLRISLNNETVREFKVVLFNDGQRTIISSIDRGEIGSQDNDNEVLYNLANEETDLSLTAEESIEGERFFKTVRAIKKDGQVIGAIYTSQSLSLADQKIEQSINNAVIALVMNLILVMVLFFRHARIIDYAVLYRKLKEINRIKDDFISIATHELRTPLTVIRGYIDILGSSKTLSEKDRSILDITDKQSKRLSLLIDDILAVPKIEQGKVTCSFVILNPEKEIEEVVESLRSVAEKDGLNLNYRVDSSALISIDKTKLKQILTNLIGNAIKYTEEGEINVIVSADKKELSIKVIDTGIGMTPEEQRGLFQKFYRIRSKATENITGTGLGLWISSMLAKAMNGTISVSSEKGLGSEFTVSFPVVE